MHCLDIGHHPFSELLGVDLQNMDALERLKNAPHGWILGRLSGTGVKVPKTTE